MSDPVKNSNTLHRGYLGGDLGVPLLRRTGPEYKLYETGYFSSGFYAGYDRVLLDSKKSSWLSEGSLRLQADYYHVGGDEGNLGSHKRQYSLLSGWKQRLSPLVFLKSDLPLHLFLDPMIGLGVADNELNFGRGFPLEEETSLNLSARFGGGAEYCFHPNACFGLRGGYAIERSLAGIGYLQRGWSVGAELEVRFSRPALHEPEPDICWQELNKVRGDFASCEKRRRDIYSEFVGLRRQIQEILVANVGLKEMIEKQVEEHKKECRDSGIVPPDFKKEITTLESYPSWTWTNNECHQQLEAARKALKECLGPDVGEAISLWNRTRVRLAEKLTQTRQIHQDLVGQLDGVLRWIYECRKIWSTTVRTPKNLILFANDNAAILTQPQRYFDKAAGRINPDLDDWIVYLSRPENRGIRARIHGYANDTGDAARNLILSQGRAENVKRYLTKTQTASGMTFGSTLVPAENAPAAQRKNCITGTTKAGLASAYCAVNMDSSRIDFAKGYGSNPTDIEKLRENLKNLKIVASEADPQHPIYRMVWLELSDPEGNFK